MKRVEQTSTDGVCLFCDNITQGDVRLPLSLMTQEVFFTQIFDL